MYIFRRSFIHSHLTYVYSHTTLHTYPLYHVHIQAFIHSFAPYIRIFTFYVTSVISCIYSGVHSIIRALHTYIHILRYMIPVYYKHAYVYIRKYTYIHTYIHTYRHSTRLCSYQHILSSL